jgi:phosphatidylserine/phosphatidylglycerophosphate/cardiolipin synthase-like enzyme
MVSRTALRAALLLLLLPALGFAQEDHIRRVLQGENATLVFGPQGGYSAQNYLKKFEATGGPAPGEQWATQNGLLAEMIRRATPGSKVLIAAFRCDEREVMDALFDVVKKNVTVKLWLKGPPGLTYMVEGHKQIAARANEYLRQRAAQNKQGEWGDFQVMIGTAAQMSAYGKINDMHEKFGVIDLVPEGGAGHNHAFLGTSNIGSSSDRSHNESRLFFHSNPQAAQALWKEFARLWTHLGECETFVDGQQGAGKNATPERPEAARIRIVGGFADEGPDDVLQFRFTYEREGGDSGPFHRISRDFIQALDESAALPQGSVVWIGQFGFQVWEITQALLRVARSAPHVEYRVMVHMGEAETGDVRRLVDAKLPNLKCGIKWDSGKLLLERGSRPTVPDHDHPGPALLHHKTMLVGDRVMITGSFNFFPDADDQGEGVVIIRNHLAPTYAHVLADQRAEFEALWRSPVLMDAALVHADGGLMDTIEALSDEDGFLEALGAVGASPRTVAEVASAAGVSQDDARRFLDALERFDFVQKDEDGRFYKAEPDVVAHAAKPGVRAGAVDAPVEPDPPVGPTEGRVRGRVVSATRLQGDDAVYTLSDATGSDVTKTLALLTGRLVEVEGTITPTGQGSADVAARRLVLPVRGQTTGVVVRDAGQLYLRVNDKLLEAFGPAGAVLGRAVGRQVKVDGYALTDALCVLAVEAEAIKRGRITKNFVGVATLPKGAKVWVSRLASNGSQAAVDHQGRAGYFPTANLAFGVAVPGLVNALPGQ